MPANPPDDTPRISPYLFYQDVAGALEFLARAFGLEERMRITGNGGVIEHAEMTLSEGVVMLGCPGPDYRNPDRLGALTQCLYVYVDDLDAHFERAKAAGATIVDEPAEQFYGDRRYSVKDCEGHFWFFAEHVRDVPRAELDRASR